MMFDEAWVLNARCLIYRRESNQMMNGLQCMCSFAGIKRGWCAIESACHRRQDGQGDERATEATNHLHVRRCSGSALPILPVAPAVACRPPHTCQDVTQPVCNVTL